MKYRTVTLVVRRAMFRPKRRQQRGVCLEHGVPSRGVVFSTALLVSLTATVLALAVVPRAQAVTLPPGFTEKTVFTGLTQPTAVRFSPDGRVFVAEKSGLIKEFDSLTDTTHRVSETPS
jgi:hypothetical protein